VWFGVQPEFVSLFRPGRVDRCRRNIGPIFGKLSGSKNFSDFLSNAIIPEGGDFLLIVMGFVMSFAGAFECCAGKQARTQGQTDKGIPNIYSLRPAQCRLRRGEQAAASQTKVVPTHRHARQSMCADGRGLFCSCPSLAEALIQRPIPE